MITREFDCTYYSETLLFYTGCTAGQLLKHLEGKHKVPKAHMSGIKKHSCTVGFAHHTDDLFILWYRTPEDLSALVHELYHICTKMFEYKGVPISYENDETMAYYMSYWMSKIIAALKEENVTL